MDDKTIINTLKTRNHVNKRSNERKELRLFWRKGF
jgi:hypothetical protein